MYGGDSLALEEVNPDVVNNLISQVVIVIDI
jgi:hypothetical protein